MFIRDKQLSTGYAAGSRTNSHTEALFRFMRKLGRPATRDEVIGQLAFTGCASPKDGIRELVIKRNVIKTKDGTYRLPGEV